MVPVGSMLSKLMFSLFSVCSGFLYDSTANEGISGSITSKGKTKSQDSRAELITQSMQEFMSKEEDAFKANSDSSKVQYSNFSGSLSMALCCILPAIMLFSDEFLVIFQVNDFLQHRWSSVIKNLCSLKNCSI